MLHAILDLIYPVRCPICSEVIVPKKDGICITCRKKLNYIDGPRCKKCSKPIEYEEKEYCGDCEKNKYHYIKGYSLWTYDEEIKQSIANFKYHSKKEYAKFYISEMVQLYGNIIKELSPDVIVPIPIHRSKYLERGYNQADILARGMGKEISIPVISNLLIRNKKTLPQKKLSNKERLSNLQEAFSFNEKALKSFHTNIDTIVLVDDIYTTGSTIEACTNVLIRSGISEVYFITLCIGKGYGSVK